MAAESQALNDLAAAEEPPSSVLERATDGSAKCRLTIRPAKYLVIGQPVAFDIVLPLGYPAMPPLVSCLNPQALPKVLQAKNIDRGWVKLKILQANENWNRNYTVSHAIWALFVMVQNHDFPILTTIPANTPLSARTPVQAAGHAGRRGMRATMEDETCAFPNMTCRGRTLGFYAVYDGHGGAAMSKYASQHLHNTLVKEMGAGTETELALFRACIQTDKAFTKHLKEGNKKDQSGSTACIVVVEGSNYISANLGDSRAVLSRAGSAVDLTKDQKASSPSEVARIVAADGFVLNNRVLGYLAVARALGDAAFKPSKASEPQLVSTEPIMTRAGVDEDDEFMVLACDGLWDVMSSQEVIDYVRPLLAKGSSPQECASNISQHAIDRGSTDNVSVVVVKLGDGPTTLSAGEVHAAPAARSSAPVSRSRKHSTHGELPATLLALVSAEEKAEREGDNRDNPYSRRFGGTKEAAAKRSEIVKDFYGDEEEGPEFGAGAGSDSYGSGAGRSPVVASAARRSESGRTARGTEILQSPRLRRMSEDDKRRLSRDGARLLAQHGVLGGPPAADKASDKVETDEEMMAFFMDDSNFKQERACTCRRRREQDQEHAVATVNT